jgi:hypothetical protein
MAAVVLLVEAMGLDVDRVNRPTALFGNLLLRG